MSCTEIFNNPKLEKISFNSLTDGEKDTYRLFTKIIFNDNYQYQLNPQTREQLKASSDDYWQYFAQIQNLLQVKK